MDFVKAFLIISTVQFVRYFILAGLGWMIFWAWKNPFTRTHRIQSVDFKKEDIKRELSYSVLSAFIFGFVLTFGFSHELQMNYALNYRNPNTPFWSDFGWVVFLIFIQDTYFYWMHRAVHHPKLFRRIHRVHHLSKNPSPWASLAFHPYEAFLEIIWVLPLRLFLPIPLHVWMVFALIIIAINVIGHLGVEIYPRSWERYPILKYLNRSTQHNDHHHYVHGNYGLYFTVWDRLMGTLREEKRVETKATSQEPELAALGGSCA